MPLPSSCCEWEYFARRIDSRVGEKWERNRGARSFGCAKDEGVALSQWPEYSVMMVCIGVYVCVCEHV